MEPVINNANLDFFWKYIIERYSIYIKKKNGEEFPWTRDDILLRWKFTNVFRDTDPGTLFVTDKIIPTFKKDFENLLFNIVIYRIYNKISTMENIGFQRVNNYNSEDLDEKFRSLIKDGKITKVFTNAFVVPSYRFVCPDKDKIGRSCILINKIKDLIPSICINIMNNKDSEFTYKSLLKLPGIGKFLSYQICVDLGYWDQKIFDENKYVVAGPGCINGLKRIFIDRKGMSYESCIKYLVDIQYEGFEKNGYKVQDFFKERDEPYLNLMSIENCLCEISKYLKIYYNEGRPRNKYRNSHLI